MGNAAELLKGLLQGWVDTQRKKEGMPTQQEHDQAAQDRALALTKAGLGNEQLQAQIGLTGAQTEHTGALTDAIPAQTELNTALKNSEITRNLRGPQTTEHLKEITLGNGNVGIIDLRTKDVTDTGIKAYIKPDKGTTISITPGMVDGQPGWVDRKSGKPVRDTGSAPPMPATMQQSQGMAQAASSALKRMHELANPAQGTEPMVSGPIAGNISKLSQRVMGPSGAEGEFDFLGNQLVDTVYLKSGKQINENEMTLLKNMIPNRGRGNLPEQVRLFEKYANTLLAKYGGESLSSESADHSPQGLAAPGPPGGTSLDSLLKKHGIQ